MFVDFRGLGEETVVDTDICVVGAGPAGIVIADAFNQTRIRVCLVESGGFEPKAEIQDLADGEMIGHPEHDVRTSRDRQFGGSTNSWAGACAPMSAQDFEPRSWVPDSGWPYAKRDLDPYYQRVQKMFEIGPWDYDPARWSRDDAPFLDVDPDRLETRIWQLSPRTNFGKTFRPALQASSNVTVLLNTTATEIVTDGSAGVVEGVEVATLDGRRATIKARFVVLACGGIDNARLLLLSRRHTPNGLGNGHDLVGRYFMQHPHVSAASVRFTGAKRWVQAYKDYKVEDLWLRARIGLTEQAQSRHRILNPVASLINRFIADSLTHTQSIGYVSLKRILLDLRHGRVPANLTFEAKKVFKDVDGITMGLLKHLRHQNGALHFMSEQCPNPDSRITLSGDRDRLGLNKVVIDWRLNALDKRSIRVAVQEIADEFRRLGVAEIVPDEWLVADDHSWPASLAGGHHHMGSTRMSDDPGAGVVDADARVHGIENLYVAGSSIFPTVGCANPTLTLVATSVKLADHLQARLARLDEVTAVA